MNAHRVGMIVPSSNVTMETEVPELLRRREAAGGERFTFHSSRVRLTRVDAESLAAMNQSGARAAAELADARCDVISYACLVAAMSEGPGGHRQVEETLAAAAAAEGCRAPVLSAAGALVEGLQHLKARKVCVIAPYVPELTKAVIEYLGSEGIEVMDSISLCVPDNLEVGALDQDKLPGLVATLDLGGADALVLSACVQMPSLAAVEAVERAVDIPVLSASIATTWKILTLLDVPAKVPGAGALLS